MILNPDNCNNKMSAETDDIQMQPLDLSCPRRSSCYDDGLAMTPPHIGTTILIDRPRSAESDSDSERPRNFTKSALRMSSGSLENEGPARKRFLSKYLYKDTPGKRLRLVMRIDQMLFNIGDTILPKA